MLNFCLFFKHTHSFLLSLKLNDVIIESKDLVDTIKKMFDVKITVYISGFNYIIIFAVVVWLVFCLGIRHKFPKISEVPLCILLQLCAMHLYKADLSTGDYELIMSINSKNVLKTSCALKQQKFDQDLIFLCENKMQSIKLCENLLSFNMEKL